MSKVTNASHRPTSLSQNCSKGETVFQVQSISADLFYNSRHFEEVCPSLPSPLRAFVSNLAGSPQVVPFVIHLTQQADYN